MNQDIEKKWDHIVIGGGFYGCILAVHLAQSEKSVLLIEKNDKLLQEASFVNQARVHNGYHYPRSVLTALRSRESLPRFVDDFPDAIDNSFEKYYAIARSGSKVTARQFELFCHNIGAECDPATDAVSDLFNKHTIEAVFRVKEFAFNAQKLAEYSLQRLQAAGVTVRYSTTAHSVQKSENKVRVILESGESLVGGEVWNVTYAGINDLLQHSHLPLLPLRYEWTEMGLVEPPDEFQGRGVTVMDGPFFSMMPFPARKLYSFSHVRYTPHYQWTDQDKTPVLSRNHSNMPLMLADAARFVPSLQDVRVHDSIWTVKTILMQNDQDDGRPILFRQHYGIPNFHVIMGGKIDNIYDIIHFLQDGKKNS
jgi:glycine/D-amino acid oxidase-like deaminating enzyme